VQPVVGGPAAAPVAGSAISTIAFAAPAIAAPAVDVVVVLAAAGTADAESPARASPMSRNLMIGPRPPRRRSRVHWRELTALGRPGRREQPGRSAPTRPV